MFHWHRYLAALALTVLGLAVATLSLTIIVDPYRFFGTEPVKGWTAQKPRVYQQADLAKSAMLARARPATLLLGNSRVEVGLNPDSPSWPATLRPVFNAALAGHDLFSALLYLQDDLALKPPKLVVLGVDFQDFIQAGDDPSTPGDVKSESRMLADRYGAANLHRSHALWADTIASTLTLDALSDSVMTLALQSPSSVTMTADGFNPLRDYDAIVRREGAHNLFAQKQEKYEAQYRTFAPSDFRNARANPEFRYLISIMNACTAHHVKLIVFTYPYHAQYYGMLHRLGLWQSFISWKQALTQTLGRTASARGNDIRLYDFALSNGYSNEQVPPTGDRHSRMRWYWESGHFKSALGDRVIARMMGEDSQLGTVLVQSKQTPEHLAATGARQARPTR